MRNDNICKFISVVSEKQIFTTQFVFENKLDHLRSINRTDSNSVRIVLNGTGKLYTDKFVGGLRPGTIFFTFPNVSYHFHDAALIKTADLDEICRQQQVNDGCFVTIDDVPKQALTLTIPALTKAKYMFCTVPAATKRWAVKETVNGVISEACPATIMRKHEHAVLYCDMLSGTDLI